MKKKIEAGDIYQLKFPSTPRMNAKGDKIAYVHKWIDKEKDSYKTTIRLYDITRNKDIKFLNGESNTQPEWHPGGHHFLYVSTENHQSEIRLMSAYGGESSEFISLPRGTLKSMCYSPDGKWLAVLFQADNEEQEYEEDGTKKTETVRHIDRLFYRLDGSGYEPKQKTALYLYKITSRKLHKVIKDASSHITSFAWAHHSKALVYVYNDQDEPDMKSNRDSIYIWDIKEKTSTRIEKPDGPVESVFYSQDDSSVFFTGHFHPESGWGVYNMSLHSIHLTNGETKNWTENLDRTMSMVTIGDITPSFTVQNPVLADNGESVYFTVSSEGGNPLHKLHLGSGEIDIILEGPEVIVDYSASAKADVFVLHLAQMERPDELWLLHIQEEIKLAKLTGLNDKYVESRDFNYPEVHTITVEGALVQSWIIKPPDFDPKKKYPLLLEIHGGPRAQYGYTWFHEMQVMAAQGYIVVYSNPQGSQGYGQEFAAAIAKKWAEPAYSDLMSVLDYVIEMGNVDEDRVFVTGGSYGGYMTNWIVGHTRRFKAAVTQRSVANLETFFSTSDIGWEIRSEFSDVPWKAKELYQKWSPISYAGDIDTPLLILHSENDLRCPMEQAEQLFVRLKYDNKQVKLISFPEESHGLSRSGSPKRRVERLDIMISFFKEFL